MPDLATIVILGFIAYRSARLVAIDSISEDARAWLYRWAWEDVRDWVAEHGAADIPDRFVANGQLVPARRGRMRAYVYELVSCPFCIGVWFAGFAFVVWAVWLGSFPNFAVSLMVVLAVAGVQALMQESAGALQKIGSELEDDH